MKTTKITRDEASEWLRYLKLYTLLYLNTNWSYYYNKEKYWPLRAQKKRGGEQIPKFTVHHHTSNKNRDYRPAMHRFFSAKKASSNFVVNEKGNIIYLVDVYDQSYHAVNRTSIPLKIKRLLNIESGWINEPGIETAGNGNIKLFTYKQFKSIICLQRYLNSYFPSIETIKSHRYFSPISRKGDPGPLYFLTLIEHAAFNDIDLNLKDYWLENYKQNPVKVANEAIDYMKEYGVEEKDEWSDIRPKLKVDDSFL